MSRTEWTVDVGDAPAGAAGLCRRDVALLGVLCLLVYGRGLGGDFHYDDLHSIVDNEHIRSLSQIPAFFTDPTTFSGLPFGGMFRPLVMVSYALTYAVAGLEPMLYLATNLGVHIGVSLLVAIVLLRFGLDHAVALAAASLVAVHPVNVETVVYVSSRSESMCAAFLLLSLWAHTHADRRIQWLSVPGLAAALACKSVGIVLLPMLVVYEIWFRRARPWRRALGLVPHALMSAVYLTLVSPSLSTSLLQAPVRGPAIQLATQIKALGLYLHLLVLPWGLSVEHQFETGHWGQISVWTSLLLLISGLILLLATRMFVGDRQHRVVGWWVLWGGIVLMPTLVVPLNVLVNEHRLYMVTFAFAVCICVALQQVAPRIRHLGVFALILMAVLSFQRCAVWADSRSLWEDALARAPMMPRAHLFVGDAEARDGRYGLALAHYERALTVNPGMLSAADRLILCHNRGAALLSMGAFPQARDAFAAALEIEPSYRPSQDAVAGLSALMGRRDEEQALAARRAGLSAMVAGELGAAIHYLRQSLEVVSDGGTWLALAGCHERLGQVDAAVEIYRMLMLEPTSATAQTAAQRLERLGRSATEEAGS